MSERRESVALDVVDKAGRTRGSTVTIHDVHPARVDISSDNLVLAAEGEDLLVCLIAIRQQLEARGLHLCCQGARPEVWPSGQLRQFTNGRSGYVLTSVSAGTVPQDVDLFAPARPEEIGTVEEQLAFVRRFHGLSPA